MPDNEYTRIETQVNKLADKFDAILLQFMRRDEYEKRHEALEKRNENLEVRVANAEKTIVELNRSEIREREVLRDRFNKEMDDMQTAYDKKVDALIGRFDTLTTSIQENRMTNIRLGISLFVSFLVGGGLAELAHVFHP